MTILFEQTLPKKVLKMHSHQPARGRDYLRGAWVSCLSIGVAACSASPSRNILGSYFPTWMVCALLGIVVVVVIRGVLVKTGIDATLPVPVIVYLSMWTAATLAIWLLWLA
ncbi:hypothetical protein EKH79_15365 [Dyella dinghuensis]|uniref:Uncharacterized protein YtcA n=1 Tax=Dyella dinghuensis TaxID=1920169 RepID=A0A432LQ13_9GAMM|nr:hypothetical protein EKH79_15365 [Dyella dinghuensis]